MFIIDPNAVRTIDADRLRAAEHTRHVASLTTSRRTGTTATSVRPWPAIRWLVQPLARLS